MAFDCNSSPIRAVSYAMYRASLFFSWLLSVAGSLVLTAGACAFDWNAAGSDLGAVEAKETNATPIEEGISGKPWKQVPPVLTDLKPTLLAAKKDNVGFVEYRVTKSGWVFFAGHFGREGRGGDWEKDRWDERRLQQDGWTEITAAEIGGPLSQVENGGRTWKIFAKGLTVGEFTKMRINKYTPPYFFSFANTPTTAFAAVPKTVSSANPTPPPAIPPPPAPPSTPTSPAPVSAAGLVKANRSNLVFVTTPDGAGSGFIAAYGTGTFLITNAHVAAGAKGAMFKTLDGTQVQIGAPAVAVGHDIFLMAVAAGGTPIPVMTGVDQNAAIGDAVVVLGNAEGAGVINTIQGKIVGLGPNLVEVDAAFQPGNSGSPIIHLKTGKVIGVATYLTIRKYDSATKEAVKAPIVRRFGYRLDSVKTWQPVNWQGFYAQATEMEAVEKLTNDLVAFLRDLGKNGRVTRGMHTNPLIKSRIDQWLETKGKRLSAQDAMSADQSMLSFLKITCQTDITAVQPRITYDYFQRQLADQQRERTEISGIFGKIIENVR